MRVEWFCQVMGSEVGPLDQAQLVDMVRQHQLNPEDLVRRNTSSWVPAFEVKGLFEAASKPASPPSKPKERADPASEQDVKPANRVHRENATQRIDSAATSKPKTNPTHNRLAGDIDISANDWFCIATGEKFGPVGFDQLRSLADEGKLRGRDRVWRGSWPKYRTAADVDELKLKASQ